MERQIKNKTCYHFDDIINIHDLYLDNIAVADVKDGVYNISYKDLCGLKPFQIIFNNVNGYINKDKYFSLFSSKKYNQFYDKIRYLIKSETGMQSVYSHNAKIKIDTDQTLPTDRR